MRIAALLAAASVVVAPHSLAQDAPSPVPIAEWPLEKIEAMGREIYIQDVAAWVATDALIAHLAGAQPKGIAGWIVTGDGPDRLVRFVTRDGETISAGWDIMVTAGRAGPVKVVTGQPLSDSEQARFRARQTAIEGIGPLRCSPNLNTVVADDPDSDGWLVWLLTATTEANLIPVGGHYRFQVSADGRQVLRRDQLSNSCLALDLKFTRSDYEEELLFVTHLVSSAPVETHVFLSLQNRIPFGVGTADAIYSVEGDEITKINDVP